MSAKELNMKGFKIIDFLTINEKQIDALKIDNPANTESPTSSVEMICKRIF